MTTSSSTDPYDVRRHQERLSPLRLYPAALQATHTRSGASVVEPPHPGTQRDVDLADDGIGRHADRLQRV
jgi:hypothetical protein